MSLDMVWNRVKPSGASSPGRPPYLQSIELALPESACFLLSCHLRFSALWLGLASPNKSLGSLLLVLLVHPSSVTEKRFWTHMMIFRAAGWALGSCSASGPPYIVSCTPPSSCHRDLPEPDRGALHNTALPCDSLGSTVALPFIPPRGLEAFFKPLTLSSAYPVPGVRISLVGHGLALYENVACLLRVRQQEIPCASKHPLAQSVLLTTWLLCFEACLEVTTTSKLIRPACLASHTHDA